MILIRLPPDLLIRIHSMQIPLAPARTTRSRIATIPLDLTTAVPVNGTLSCIRSFTTNPNHSHARIHLPI